MCDRCETLKQCGLYADFEREKEQLQAELDARLAGAADVFDVATKGAREAYEAALKPAKAAFEASEDAIMDGAERQKVELWSRYSAAVEKATGKPLFTPEELTPRPPHAEQRKARAAAMAQLERLFGKGGEEASEDEAPGGGLIITDG